MCQDGKHPQGTLQQLPRGHTDLPRYQRFKHQDLLNKRTYRNSLRKIPIWLHQTWRLSPLNMWLDWRFWQLVRLGSNFACCHFCFPQTWFVQIFVDTKHTQTRACATTSALNTLKSSQKKVENFEVCSQKIRWIYGSHVYTQKDSSSAATDSQRR